jgi:catechol 2,3-dioxygenase-like lactoylglutathione lyase family enzyme
MGGNIRPSILKAHIALNVSNVEKSVEFYTRMLAIGPMKVRPGYAKFDVQNPPLNLTLNAAPASAPGALSHLGLQVGSTEDVLAVKRQWTEAGLAVRDEMNTECCYALQDKSWVSDPDGNEWEVFTVIADVEPAGNACCQPLVQLLK